MRFTIFILFILVILQGCYVNSRCRFYIKYDDAVERLLRRSESLLKDAAEDKTTFEKECSDSVHYVAKFIALTTLQEEKLFAELMQMKEVKFVHIDYGKIMPKNLLLVRKAVSDYNYYCQFIRKAGFQPEQFHCTTRFDESVDAVYRSVDVFYKTMQTQGENKVYEVFEWGFRTEQAFTTIQVFVKENL